MYLFLTVNILVNIEVKFSDTSHGNRSSRQPVPPRDTTDWSQMWDKPQHTDTYPVRHQEKEQI